MRDLNDNFEFFIKRYNELNEKDHHISNSSMMSRDYLWSKDFHVRADDTKYLDEKELLKLIPLKKHNRNERS